MYCYLNGKILPENKAHIGLYDLGLLRGYGVFDFMKCQSGKVILLERHLDRLFRSAKLANLKMPHTRTEIKSIIAKLLRLNKLADAYVRVVLTGGESIDGITCDQGKPTFFILVQTIGAQNDNMQKNGVKLITCEYQRKMPAAKSTDYMMKLRLQQSKLKAGAHEILYVHKDLVLEGASCNFFLFRGRTLITAKDNILAGTRRGIILKLARKEFPIEIRTVKIAELEKANEAFISSTTRNILPVTKIDDQLVGDGKVGKNTRLLIQMLHDHINSNLHL